MSKRFRVGEERDAVLLIPVARKDTYRGRAARVEQAVLWLWSRGIYPSPSALSMRLRGKATRTINGYETSIRNAVMERLGITRQRRGPFPINLRSRP